VSAAQRFKRALHLTSSFGMLEKAVEFAKPPLPKRPMTPAARIAVGVRRIPTDTYCTVGEVME